MTIREEIDPYVMSPRGLVGISDEATLNTINGMIARVTDCDCQTPYISLERIRKVLSTYHINLPKYTILDGEEGNAVFTISQFGEKFGIDSDGDVAVKNSDNMYLYFEYLQNEEGKFDVFAEIVDGDDLQELLAAYEADDAEEDSDEGEMEDEGDDDEGPDMINQGQEQSHETNYDEHKGLRYA